MSTPDDNTTRLSELVRSVTVAFKPAAEALRKQLVAVSQTMARLRHLLEPGQCRTCNPRGNPAPLARGLIKGGKR